MKIIILNQHFSLYEPDLISTIETLRLIYKASEDTIFLNFSEILKIGEGDLMVLFAQLEKITINSPNKKIFRAGPLPKDKDVKKLLLKTIKVEHFIKKEINNLSIAERENLILSSPLKLVQNESIKNNNFHKD